MVVRDEARQIADCLAPIIDFFDEVAVVDTGPLDGPPETLRHELGVTPHWATLEYGGALEDIEAFLAGKPVRVLNG